ncbi:distal tail protein Dit [Streptococcus minor]|uniref:distal tail protein Dit n=1 Tax=Streptococcus minor TaxID=229549 RepID=UPI0004780141|nr:distal tail protein Dit [Streptococcus minor]
MEKVFFNGVELTKYITVARGFTLNIGADFEPSLNSYDVLSGAEFTYTRKKEKVIPIPFYNKTGSFEEYNLLLKALNVETPKELKFSSWPNKVFYAIPVETLDFEVLARANGRGTLKFIVADGLAHSTNQRPFSFTRNEEGILEATIVNEGSEPVSVDYEVKLKKESGFLGIASPYGAIQFGKVEEVDGLVAEKNVVLSSNKAGNFANWTDGTVFYESQNKKSVTNMSSDTADGGRLGLLPSSFSNNANGVQFGAIKELTLSETAQNWYIWARACFETGLVNQTGAWCLAVVDDQNRFIAGMAIEKTNTTANIATVHFLMGDGAGGSRSVKSINFTPHAGLSNPYGSEARKQNRNMFDIKKEGEKVTFFWYGSYHSSHESKIKNAVAKKVQFFTGQYRGRTAGNQLVSVHYLNDFSFTKIKVPYWKDIPNRYSAGSVLRVVGQEGKLYVNNQLAPDGEIMGTKFFKVPPGETKVQLLVSSFSEVESAVAKIKEAYI